jgi:hypothetical protein
VTDRAAGDTSTQAYSVQRANHTGTQLAATISDFDAAAVAAGSGTYRFFVNVKSYGAVGDGVTDDTTAVQAALTYAATFSGTKAPTLFFPQGDYLLTASLAMSTGRLSLRGEGKKASRLVAGPAFTGYLVNPTVEFDISDLSFVGNGLTGAYGLGGTSGSMGTSRLSDVAFSGWDYAVRFSGTSSFPLSAVWRNVYCNDFLTAGIVLNQAVESGQSAWTFDNVICTNGGATGRCTLATGYVETPNTPDSTHDQLDWTGTNATEFGYVVLRRPTGSTDTEAWTHVAYVPNGTLTYSATKVAGENWDYAVVRNTHGMYLRFGKAVDCGTIQTEYVGTGVAVVDCKAISVDAFYDEWQGTSLTFPTPRGDGIKVTTSSGIDVGAAWGEGLLSVVSLLDTPGRIGPIVAASCQRSAVHNAATTASTPVEIGPASLAGTTPAVLSTGGSAYDHNYLGRNVSTAAASVASEHLSHTTLAEYVTENRGARRAALGGDGTSGYLDLSSAALPPAGSTYDRQVRYYAGQLYVCANDGVGYAWVPFAKAVQVSNDPGITLLGATRADSSQPVAMRYDGIGRWFLDVDRELVVGGAGKTLRIGTATSPLITSGSGTPEGVVTAPIGSLYQRSDGGAGTSLYVKESGTGNTGWIAK